MLRLILSCLTFLLFGTTQAAEDRLVVYSARNEQLIKPLFDEFSKETGIRLEFITDKDGVLIQRLKAEGRNTPADVLVTVDAGNLWFAKSEGLLQPVSSPVLEKNIPPHLRDPDNQWFGLSVRARTIVYSTRRVRPGELSTYEQLAEPAWKGRLCLRTAKKVYNQSLVAMLIARHGVPATERIVAGWVQNLAAPVFSNDTQVMEAIAAGQCDVGIVNTYYYGRLVRDKPGLPVAIHWPNQHDDGGVHVNVSGAGIVRHARHPAAALRLLEWLSDGHAQSVFASSNLEYPANPAVAVDPAVAAWGEFRQSAQNLSEAGRLQAAAIRLMDRAGYR